MAFETFTIDSKTGTTGTQVYSVLGATPSAMVFFGGAITALDTDTTPVSQFHGATDGTNDGCLSAGVNGNPSAADYSTTNCITIVDGGGTILAQATLSSWDATSFTLNWTTVPATTAFKIDCIAISGVKITNAFLDTFIFGTGTSKASTAPGFQPDFLLVIARKVGRNGYSVGMSIGTAVGDESAMGFRWRSSNVNRYTSYDNEKRLAVMADDSATPEQEFELDSFDANGYTIGRVTADSLNADFIVLALKGADNALVRYDSPATAIDEVVTGAGFAPEGYYINCLRVAGSPRGNGSSKTTGYGASDGTNEVAHWFDLDGVSDEDHGSSNTKVIQLRTSTATLAEDADHKSLDSDGATLNYSTVESAANEVMMWFFNGSSTGASASLANTLSSFTSSSSAAVQVQASAANTLSSFTSSSTGKVLVKASAANTLSAFVSAATATTSVTATATLANTLAAFSSSSSAKVAIKATAANSLSAFTNSSSAKVLVSATSATSLAAFSSSATATTGDTATATLANTLGAFSSAGISKVAVQATLTNVLSSFTSGAAASVTIKATLANTLSPFVSNGAIVAGSTRTATLANTLSNFTSSGVALHKTTASASNILSAFTSTLTATVSDLYTGSSPPTIVISPTDLNKGILPKVETFEDVYDEMLFIHNSIDILLDSTDKKLADVVASINTAFANNSAIRTSSVDFIALPEDSTLLLTGAANTVLGTLPSAVGIASKTYKFKAIDITNAVKVGTTGGETIDGSAANITLSLNQKLTLQSDGNNWWIV